MILKPRLFRKVNFTHPIARGLVAYWPMLEGVGNKINDLSGNRNHGTLVGDTHWAAGRSGPCLSFDGTGDYVRVLNSSSLEWTGDLTVSFWAMFDSIATNMRLIHKRDAGGTMYDIYISATNRLTWYDGVNVEAAIYLMPTGVWKHIVVTCYNGSLFMYVNNISLPIGDRTCAVTANDANLWIGSDYNGGSNFNGRMDNLAIFNRALSASEIQQLYRDPFCLIKRRINPTLIQSLIAIARRWWGYW